VALEAKNGNGTLLVLSDRKQHCEALEGLLKDSFGVSAAVLTGNVAAKKRQKIVDRLNKGKVKVLIATGQLVGEGFDCNKLSVLFLVTPVKFDGRVHQYIGRILRLAPGKDKAKIYDYVDSKVPVLRASSKSRAKVYIGKNN